MTPPAATRVRDASAALPLHDGAATRALEAQALAAEPTAHALMARAGCTTAHLALALAPHAQRIGVLAGPGNNGGDGLVAACHLRQLGRDVQVLHLADDPARLPADAADAWRKARSADLRWVSAPAQLDACDLLIDALLGLGARRPPDGRIADAITWANGRPAPVLAVDLPTGLDADTGSLLGPASLRARWTVSLLTLKPGLFMAEGRDHAGEVWFDDLGVAHHGAACAWLGSAKHPPGKVFEPRRHAQHKGSFGDVFVVGGAPGLSGAAVLAARSALAAGAGRVYLSLLDDALPFTAPAELMFRPRIWEALSQRLGPATVVCGCGGGDRVEVALQALLPAAARLVLDADALNALSRSPATRILVAERAARGQGTVLTPHPLEAARLLGCSAREVQADRLAAARRLAHDFQAVVVLKGSGTVVAAPGEPACWINGSGNARLASAGTGDVLAGWVGGLWSQADGADPAAAGGNAARAASWLHGRAADTAPGSPCAPLPAGQLIDCMARLTPGV